MSNPISPSNLWYYFYHLKGKKTNYIKQKNNNAFTRNQGSYLFNKNVFN